MLLVEAPRAPSQAIFCIRCSCGCTIIIIISYPGGAVLHRRAPCVAQHCCSYEGGDTEGESERQGQRRALVKAEVCIFGCGLGPLRGGAGVRRKWSIASTQSYERRCTLGKPCCGEWRRQWRSEKFRVPTRFRKINSKLRRERILQVPPARRRSRERDRRPRAALSARRRALARAGGSERLFLIFETYDPKLNAGGCAALRGNIGFWKSI